ncbi:MAG: rod shape-determining protein RodA [Actinomycetota bacterium]
MDLVAGSSRALAAERQPIRHIDLTLVVAAGLLASAGLALIFSANRSLAGLGGIGIDPASNVKKQLVGIAIGAILMILVATVDYRFLKVYAGFFYAAAIGMLILVQSPLGTNVNGAQRWFEFGGFQFSPAEVTKLAMICLLAAMLSEVKAPDLELVDVLKAVAATIVPMVLVFIQPDIGTSIVLIAIVVGVLVVAGARARHLVAIGLVAIALAIGVFQLGVIKEYQVQRLTAFWDSESDLAGANYNRDQAEIAIGAGGLTGRGYLSGTQTNLDFVPEQHTDFIFTVAGEEFGFVGSVGLLVLFGVLLWRAIRISYLSKDAFGTYVAAGIASMWAIQMFVNVGMVIGIMPITGIPLPFVSYGGTAILTNLLAVGMLENIHMRRFTGRPR